MAEMTMTQAADVLREWRHNGFQVDELPEVEAAILVISQILPAYPDTWYTKVTHYTLTSHASDGSQHESPLRAGEITMMFEEREVGGRHERRAVLTTDWRRDHA